MANKRKSRKRTAGIALIEILIVVAIIALISSGIAVAATKIFADSSIKMARTDASNVRQAVRTWQMMEASGQCPTVTDLVSGGHLEKGARRVDPWKRPYKITCEEGEVTVVSSGPDKQFGSQDDISVPEPEKPTSP